MDIFPDNSEVPGGADCVRMTANITRIKVTREEGSFARIIVPTVSPLVTSTKVTPILVKSDQYLTLRYDPMGNSSR